MKSAYTGQVKTIVNPLYKIQKRVIKIIRKGSTFSNKHVSGKENQGDNLFRGCNILKLKTGLWFKSPNYLTSGKKWPELKVYNQSEVCEDTLMEPIIIH